MPVPKRWFPVSRDINDDPEFEELCVTFGTAGVRIFLEVFAIFDKTENIWKISGNVLKTVARKCGTNTRIVQHVLEYFQNKEWIHLRTLPNNCMAYSARNYGKYHRNWDSKRSLDEFYEKEPCVSSLALSNCTDPNVMPILSPAPSSEISKIDEKRENSKSQQVITLKEDFTRFWTEYPRKEGKIEAMKVWKKLEGELTETVIKQILEVLNRQKLSPGWQQDGGQFIPHAARWLKGRRWEDEGTATNQGQRENHPIGKRLEKQNEGMRTGFNPHYRNYSREGW
ncbi:MAG: hypothetical protein KC587_13100 [Nitrospira sp.]|nr:hypothetical protein [Nitrospira sp.]